jgi:hypothetical protein
MVSLPSLSVRRLFARSCSCRSLPRRPIRSSTWSSPQPGFQIYRCDPQKDQPGRFEWVLQSPDAVLRDTGGKVCREALCRATWEADGRQQGRRPPCRPVLTPRGAGRLPSALRLSTTRSDGRRRELCQRDDDRPDSGPPAASPRLPGANEIEQGKIVRVDYRRRLQLYVKTIGRGMRVKAVLFDAYGTLFDVHSVVALAESYFRAAAPRSATRGEQAAGIHMAGGRCRTATAIFWQVTGDALTWAGAALELPISAATACAADERLSGAEGISRKPRGLASSSQVGLTLGTLSNGTTAMLEAALSSAAMRRLGHAMCCQSTRSDASKDRTRGVRARQPAAIGAPAR